MALPAFVPSAAWQPCPRRCWLRVQRQRERDVIKIDQLYGLVTLGETLQRLTTKMYTRRITLGEVSKECFAVRAALLHILADSLMPLDSCKKSAERLLKALDAMIEGPNLKANWSITLNPYFSDPICQELLAVEQDLATELNALPVYFATKKRAYDRDILLNAGEQLLDAADLSYLSNLTREDIRDATACLMFDRFTASGFHAARAVEGVARLFYQMVTGKWPTRDATETGQDLNLWGLIGGLQNALKPFPKADRATLVVNTLDRMRVIYRNPIMHPDVRLAENDAVQLVGLMVDAISQIIADVREGGSHFSPLCGFHV